MRNPWIQIPIKPPYVLEEDKRVIFEMNKRYSKKALFNYGYQHKPYLNEKFSIMENLTSVGS